MSNGRDRMLRAQNAVHRGMQKLSGGRIGWKALGMPVLELTTTGRRSGQSRTVLLTSPVQDGPTLVIVASKGGDDRHPDWFLNLQAQPEVDVVLGGRAAQQRMHAWSRMSTSGRAGPRIVANHKHLRRYQGRRRGRSPSSCSSRSGSRHDAAADHHLGVLPDGLLYRVVLFFRTSTTPRRGRASSCSPTPAPRW